MTHTLNGPSSLSRREKCPASMAIEAGLSRDRFDRYSDSGDRCHKAMECYLLGAQLPDLSDEEYGLVQTAIKHLTQILAGDEIIPGSMKTQSGADLMIEVRFDRLPYSMPGTSECGTCDLSIVYPDHIVLVDWKFGGSFVDHPKWNRQMQAYALGLWGYFPGREIHVAIVQPRAGFDHQMEPWIYAPEQRDQFEKELKQIVVDGHNAKDIFCVGQACQFCLGSTMNKCPARLASLNMFASLQHLKYEEIPEDIKSQVLTAARAAKQSADRILDEARAVIKATGEVPEGYRASRTSKDNVRIDANPGCPAWPRDWRVTSNALLELTRTGFNEA